MVPVHSISFDFITFSPINEKCYMCIYIYLYKYRRYHSKDFLSFQAVHAIQKVVRMIQKKTKAFVYRMISQTQLICYYHANHNSIKNILVRIIVRLHTLISPLFHWSKTTFHFYSFLFTNRLWRHSTTLEKTILKTYRTFTLFLR